MSQISSIRQLHLLRAEAAKRKQLDGLEQWHPYRKQQDFIDAVLCGEGRENWFIAANRAGKSDAGAYIGSTLARYGPQKENSTYSSAVGTRTLQRTRATSGWVIAVDFPTSRDVIQPKYFNNGFVPPGATHPPFIPPHEIESWSVGNQVLRLKNGSIIGFKSADSGRSKFQGTEKDWVHIDEEIGNEIYNETVIRVGQNPLNVFGTCTILPPEGEGGGITWLYSEKIVPFLRDRANAHATIWGASIYDNPHLPSQEIRRLEAIYPLGSTERRIRLEGEWLPGIGGARAYPAFEMEHNVSDQQAYYNPRRPLAWCWDFNVEPMVCLVGQQDGHVLRVFDELIKEDGDIPSLCDRFFQKWGHSHRGEFHIFGDATGRGRSGQTGQSSYYMILSTMMSLRSRIKLRVPEANPQVIDRINAMNHACRNEHGERLLQVDPRCTQLIQDFEQVLRDSSGGVKKTTRRRDPYVRRTHYTDALGYWVSLEKPVHVRPLSQHSSVNEFRRPVPDAKYG